MAANIEEHILKLNDKFSGKLDKINANVEKLRGNIGKTEKTGSNLGRTLGRAFVALGAGLAIKQVASLGIEMEQTRVAFTTFLGSAEKGNKLIAELNEFANITPFNNAEIIKSGRLLLAAGIPAEGIADQLKSIGDVAAGANVPITELAAIFQKATNKGKLQAEELNQFSERGIPILDELSRMFGKSKEEVLKLGSQGKITSDIMNKAFENMTSEGGLFFNLMEKQSQTVGGRISTLVGKLQLIGITIGERILPALGKFVDGLLASVKWITENVNLLKQIGVVILAAATAWGIYSIVANKAAIAQKLLNIVLALNPIGLVVAAIAALAVGFVILFNKSEQFRSVLLGIWEIFKALWKIIFDFITGPLANFAMAVVNIGKTVFKFLISPFMKAGDAVGGVFDFIKEKIISFLGLLAKIPVVRKLIDKFNVGFDKGKESSIDTSALDPAKGLGGAAGVGGLGAGAGTIPSGATGKLGSGLATVKAGAPRNINISIDSLIENQNFTTSGLAETKSKIKDAVTSVLLQALNDAQVIAR